jgi:chemotaxis protein CheZ
MSDATMSGDSTDLEALFDSIASGGADAAPKAVPAAASTPAPAVKPSLMQQAREGSGATDDSDELQALFDAMAVKPDGDVATDSLDDEWQGQDKVFQRVGTMARQLHDTLCGLGYDKLVEKTVSALPDAKDRLAYIANLTEQAACRVLNATDIANPLQDKLEADSAVLAAKWDALFANQIGVEGFKQLAHETRAFLKQGVPEKTVATKEQLLEIMMAQDFQDLTGQVIKKVIAVAQELESQLMGVLIETMPGEKRTESVNSLLNGPVINAEGRTDVVGSQQQVDDLLDSLGF